MGTQSAQAGSCHLLMYMILRFIQDKNSDIKEGLNLNGKIMPFKSVKHLVGGWSTQKMGGHQPQRTFTTRIWWLQTEEKKVKILF